MMLQIRSYILNKMIKSQRSTDRKYYQDM